MSNEKDQEHSLAEAQACLLVFGRQGAENNRNIVLGEWGVAVSGQRSAGRNSGDRLLGVGQG